MEYKKQVRFPLTAKGQKVIKQAMKLDGAAQVLSKLSAAQQRQLKANLTAIKEAGMKELRLSPKALPWP